MSTFLNSLRSETTKVLSMRSTVVYAILLAGSLFGPTTLAMWFPVGEPVADWGTLNTGAMIFQLIAIVFAAATTAGDIRNHMHAQAFLTQSNRSQWVVSKIVVTMVFTAVVYIVGVLLAMLSAVIFGAGVDLGSGSQEFTANLFCSVVFAAFTVGLACVIRSQVGAVALPLAWLLVIDGMIGSAASQYEWVRPLEAITPGQRQMQLVYGDDYTSLGYDISPVLCVVIILGWFVALTGLGLWRNQRADVR